MYDMNKIGRDEYEELTSGDLCEQFELHSHGLVVELIAVSVNTQYTDSGDFDGFTLAIGRIGETCNISHVGNSYDFDDDAEYWAFEGETITFDAIKAFAWSQFCERAEFTQSA